MSGKTNNYPKTLLTTVYYFEIGPKYFQITIFINFKIWYFCLYNYICVSISFMVFAVIILEVVCYVPYLVFIYLEVVSISNGL